MIMSGLLIEGLLLWSIDFDKSMNVPRNFNSHQLIMDRRLVAQNVNNDVG